MLVEVTDARLRNNETAINTANRGPFRLDQFNLYRFWFSVRNVFFPMESQLAQWKIELVDTKLWRISCDRSNRRIEIANRVFRDRNDLRTTLILATLLTQENRNDTATLKKDMIRVARMATFIKHTELSVAIRSMNDAIELINIEHVLNDGMDLIHCRQPDSSVEARDAGESSGDMLFDDTLAASGINELLEQENLSQSSESNKLKKSNAA